MPSINFLLNSLYMYIVLREADAMYTRYMSRLNIMTSA